STSPRAGARPGFPAAPPPAPGAGGFPAVCPRSPGRAFLAGAARAGMDGRGRVPLGFFPPTGGGRGTELEARGLRLAGGTVGGALHHRAGLSAVRAQLLDVARLASALGAEHVVFLPAMYRDLSGGRQLEPAELGAEDWRALLDGADH